MRSFFLTRRDHFKAALAGSIHFSSFFLHLACAREPAPFLFERIAQNHPDVTELTRDLPIY